jgi:hypothetical protein
MEIRRCRDDDVPAVMSFIDLHWRRGHVLATSRALLDWQYAADSGFYNLVAAFEGREILGLLGYIPTNRYDASLKDLNFIWLALWKVRDDLGHGGLGLRLLTYLTRNETFRAIGVNGLNPALTSVFEAFGYRAGELAHHFMINPTLPQTLIMRPEALRETPIPKPGGARLREADAVSLAGMPLKPQAAPWKTPMYFHRRYVSHPFYQYRVFHVACDGRQGLAAIRMAGFESARCLRVIDFAGDVDVLSECGPALGALMEESGAEYIDFLELGLPSGVLEKAGFSTLDMGGQTVVPNYFEPFVPRNSRIHCAIKVQDGSPCLVFRGDGDQDRPSLLR